MAQQDQNPAAIRPLQSSTHEEATDPGLIILYDPGAVHTALGQANAPVPQGRDIAASLHNFEQYVYHQILLTPCAEEAHCVEKGSAQATVRNYHPQLFHRLPADTYREIIERLKTVFIHANTTTAAWSVSVASSAQAPNSLPPNRPLGALIKVEGGVGLGQVTMEPVGIRHGVFRFS